MSKTTARRYDTNRPWRKLYGRKRWQALRELRLHEEPLCRICRERFNRITPAIVCDHIKPHKGDEDLFHDYANTQSLCKQCHDQHKQRAEIGSAPKLTFDASGYPVDNLNG